MSIETSETTIDDDREVRLPISATSRKGFGAWVESDAFPRHVRLSLCDEGILVEGITERAKEGYSVCVPLNAGSLEGFCSWATSDAFPKRGRFSFINHEIVIDMSPEEVEKHNSVKMEISRVIGTLNRDLDLGKFYIDRLLVTNSQANLATEPDATFVVWSSFESKRVAFLPRKSHPDEFLELQGKPDWVLEIVSRNSIVKDCQDLRKSYHRAGISEYWLVNALEDEIDFQILVHHPDGYVGVTPHDGWIDSPIFGCSFRLTRQRDRLGYWQYTLHVQES